MQECIQFAWFLKGHFPYFLIFFLFSWVELTGRTSVCECCASKCDSPPAYGGPPNGQYPFCLLVLMENYVVMEALKSNMYYGKLNC